MNESCHIWMRHVTYECFVCTVDRTFHYIYVPIISMFPLSPCSHYPLICKRCAWHVTTHSYVTGHTYEWVMSHMNESCHIWMRHVTYEWNVSSECNVWTVGLFCRILSLLYGSFAKETYNFPNVSTECDVWTVCWSSQVTSDEKCMSAEGHREPWVPRDNETCHLWIIGVHYGFATVSSID